MSREVSEVLTRNLENGDIFVDIGANVGFFSRLASEVMDSNGEIYAFEVDIENYYVLLKNTNNYSNINALHCAISNSNGFANINRSTNAACHSLVNTDNSLDGSQFSVPAMTLDHFWTHFLGKKTINALKIDVEGAEMMVLEGMERLFAANKIETLIIEFCPKIMQNAGFDESEFYNKIATNFSIRIIDDEYRSLVKDGAINSISDLKTVSNKLLEEKDNAININLLCKKSKTT
ncbi:MAG: FkbM family methyltransferase [Balneolaceae bacterium]|nr:FkbM family methyltransferase [Balneolaceae bacterium]